jgi:cytochrome c-type biogenesis protein CcsB
MYTNLEIFLANFSFLILFISMLIYWIQASNFETNYKKDSFLNIQETNVNLLQTLMRIFNNVFSSRAIGTITTMVANASLFLLLVLRWKESGHFPLSNLYESLMFLSWSLTLIHLFIEIGFSSPVSLETGVQSQQSFEPPRRGIIASRLIGSITAPCALFSNAFATFSLPKEMQEASPLVPALQSNWLMMHVTVMILSYAALILGSLLSIGFLVITSGKNISLSSNPQQVKLVTIVNKVNNQTLSLGFTESSLQDQIKPSQFTENKARLNLAKTLDNLSYRVLGLGFPLLTIGILSGAVWANEAWGSYWSWDPKETWALLTWLVFAIYLHTRLTKGWEGRKPALIASLGFVTVWVCFLGVNLIGEGLHSYGWIAQS